MEVKETGGSKSFILGIEQLVSIQLSKEAATRRQGI
jgi:hypothetical protein